jgi:pyrimidine-nucleoside phosphorylase
MSKKIAAGAQAIVLDVKIGLGAFMQNEADALVLATRMVDIAKLAGRKALALLSDMNQPLGCAVGNSLELKEAIDTLNGGGPATFREHCLSIASHVLTLGGVADSIDVSRQIAEAVLLDGRAWARFRDLVLAQGGDLSFIDHPERLPTAQFIETVNADRSGYLRQIHARIVGEVAVELGGGRAKKGDPIDYAVGIIIHREVGDRVEVGQPLFTIYANDEQRLVSAKTRLLGAHQWSDRPVDPLPLYYGVIK